MNAASQTVCIDQVLHGYDRGHKEIASSVRLDEEARATMLVYSDLLAEIGGGDGSYLTCYPLPSAARQVLARTWSAGAGSRPGSVWTHSLVLDYQSLARLNDLVALEPLLMRSGDLHRIAAVKSIQLPADQAANAQLSLGPHAALALRELYGEEDRQAAVPSAGRTVDDVLALALWRQMWPGLRRAFSFVTGPAAGRPGKGPDWTLRFVDEPTYDARPDLDPGLRVLLEDLPEQGSTPLRQFLSRYASEAPDPRRAAGPLAELWSTPNATLRDRLRTVRRIGGEKLPRLTRDLVSEELSSADDPDTLIAVVEELGDQPLDVDPAQAVSMAERMDPDPFARLLSVAGATASDRLGGRMFEAIVRGCDLGRLAKASGAANRGAMLAVRPELLVRPDFWPVDDADRATLIERWSGTLELEVGLRLFGERIGPKTARSLLDGDPSAPVPMVLGMLSLQDSEVGRIAAQRLLANAEDLATALGHLEDSDALESLADVQIENGAPPPDAAAWCACLTRLGVKAVKASTVVVCHVAALDVGGRAGLKAARQTFDPLMCLVATHRLSREQERYIGRAISGGTGSWRLADRLAEAALDRWPPKGSSAGALALSIKDEHVRVLVDTATAVLTRSDLKRAALAPDLPPETVKLMKRKLDTPVWLSWWS